MIRDSAIPRLPQDVVCTLVRRWQKRKDVAARNRVVESNMPLVYKLARMHLLRSDYEDIVQEGAQGLMRSVDTYKTHSGNVFSTYAVWWIKAYIIRYTEGHQDTVVSGGLHYSTKGNPRRVQPDLRLDATVWGTDDLKLMDTIPDAAPLSDDVLVASDLAERLRNAVKRTRHAKQPLSAAVIYRRLMAEDPMTLQAIGECHDVSRERVRQVETRVKQDLARWLAPLKESV